MAKPKLKIKMISRNPDEYLRETKRDIHKVHRNYDPTLHPFQTQREYVRALNATKLERVFAKPFVGSLDGHTEGVSAMSTHPSSLTSLVSGTYDGELRLWHLPTRKCVSVVTGHTGQVRGICYNHSGEHFLSCGDDQIIRMWKTDETDGGFNTTPHRSIVAKGVMYGIDHHWNENLYATCGEDTHIWDTERNEPIRTYKWGVDSVQGVRFNPIEHNILAACASDRSIILYDIRGAHPMRKIVLKLKTNSISWNPMESYNFACANEDYNAYTFDMRGLTRPVKIHKGHVSAVLDIDYSPTGKEFCTGSFDRTVRIFDQEQTTSREVYHTKRMQIVHCIRWSKDNKYIISGSDETNIRVWKAKPSEKIAPAHSRFHEAQDYNEKLKDKFKDFPQIKRIAKHRHVPRRIYNAQKEIMIQTKSQRRKKKNVKAHSKPGTVKDKPDVKQVVLREEV